MPSAAPRSSLSVRLPAIPLDRLDDSPCHKSSPSQVWKTPIGGVSAKRPWPALILAIDPDQPRFPAEFVPPALQQSRHPAMTVQGHEQTNRPRQFRVCFGSVNRLQSREILSESGDRASGLWCGLGSSRGCNLPPFLSARSRTAIAENGCFR